MRLLQSIVVLLLTVLGLAGGLALDESPNNAARGLSNAEKMARGLPLNRPSRLYDSKRALRPRASPVPTNVFIKVYQSSNNALLGYIGYTSSYVIVPKISSALKFLLPDKTGTYAEITIPSFTSYNVYGLAYDDEIGMASQTGYDPANGGSDGGNPSASADGFQTSVFSWTSATSQITSTVATSSGGRTVVYGWTDGTVFEYAQAALNDYPTKVYFQLTGV